ncbi:acetate kinase 2 [Clostridium sp. CAG:710]|nr:acetate kinase 2 [Clostridium sp. CAG:710]
MKIMSINAGSSSLKFSLFNMDTKEILLSGLFERIGIEGSCYTLEYGEYKIKNEALMETHLDAVKILMDKLLELKIVNSLEEIDGIGHRIVHGGAIYKESVVVTDKVLDDIIALSDLAPLHNPAHAMCIKAFREVLPNTPMVVVFDTAFHQTIEKDRFLYPVPYNWYTDYQVRKYGAHGTSHRYVAKKLQEELGRDDLNIISCHLGNGGSITAISCGKCVDTSMGFTPHAGIMMGTRSGDIDVSMVPYVMEKEGKSAGEIMNDLNKKSGFLGISGLSSDSRDIEDGIKEGNERCILAQKMFVNSVIKYIAQYYVLLGHVDVIAFTAGIGEKSISTRSDIIERLAPLGIEIDPEENNVRGKFKKISSKKSSVDIYVVPTNEELMIAEDTLNLIK